MMRVTVSVMATSMMTVVTMRVMMVWCRCVCWLVYTSEAAA